MLTDRLDVLPRDRARPRSRRSPTIRGDELGQFLTCVILPAPGARVEALNLRVKPDVGESHVGLLADGRDLEHDVRSGPLGGILREVEVSLDDVPHHLRVPGTSSVTRCVLRWTSSYTYVNSSPTAVVSPAMSADHHPRGLVIATYAASGVASAVNSTVKYLFVTGVLPFRLR